MTPERKQALQSNMFVGARGSIDDWSAFEWHRYAHSPRSSQMLAIDVFGTLKVSPQVVRDRILSALAKKAQVSPKGPWQIALEWQDKRNALNERRLTQVDVIASSQQVQLFFECKFTEIGGSCSQTKRDKKGDAACNGSYETQTNPRTGVSYKCALSNKGIIYWEWIEKLYGLSVTEDYSPCPFSSDAYQWMRNSALAAAIQKRDSLQTRVFAVYAESQALQTAEKVRSGCLGFKPISTGDEIIPISYQSLLSIAEDLDPNGGWPELSEWVEQKIAAVESSEAPETQKLV